MENDIPPRHGVATTHFVNDQGLMQTLIMSDNPDNVRE